MSGSTGPRSSTSDRLSHASRRVVTVDRDAGARLPVESSIGGAPRWAAGLAAGLQAAILSLAVIVAPTLAAYVATAADPSNDNVSWLQAVNLGGGLWLLGHGVPLAASGTAVTLMPLGITALALFTCFASARRTGQPSRSGFWTALGGYLAVVLAVALAQPVGPLGFVRAVVGGALLGAIGLGAGLLSQRDAPRLTDLSRPLWRRLPGFARTGGSAGLFAVALLVGFAVLVTVGWILVGSETIAGVGQSLGADAVGGTVLAVAQLALVPNLVVWALAFVAGPGFALGAGSHFTPAGVVAGPLPALPVLGALPAPGSIDELTAWWPIALVVAGALTGWFLHDKLPRGTWWHVPAACGVAAVVAGLGCGTLVSLASGSAGPGRMADVGGSGALVGLAVGLGVALGCALVAIPSSADVRVAVARGWDGLRHGGPAR